MKSVERGIKMIDIILEAVLDSLKIVPFLFVTFLILELLEHKLNKKSEKVLLKYKKLGPVVGGVLGVIPQCGFGSMAASLFSSKVITIGTVVAIFLSTSDEMLPIMLGHKTNIGLIISILGFKVLVGIIIGLVVDLIFRKKGFVKENVHINDMCCDEHCHCEDNGVFKSSLVHTLKITLFILIANLLINFIIFFIGEEQLGKILLNENIFTYFIASLVGLIPNCASSVVLTELYLSNLISIGTMFSGLLTGSGLGILLLFKFNKNIKENVTVLGIIYFVGVIVGIIVDLFI